MIVKSLVVAALVASAGGSAVAGDPVLPAAQRAKVEKLGAIQQPTIYIAPTRTGPARWLVFVGTATAPALSAWLVTPGAAALEVAELVGWPTALKVVGSAPGLHPSESGSAPEASMFLVVESLAATELGQPAGLRSLVPIGIPAGPKDVTGVNQLSQYLPSYGGVKDASDVPARTADLAKAYTDTADKVFATDGKLAKLLTAARKSDPQLAKLIPKSGIPVLERWQSTFVRERGRITKLDRSADVKALRLALAAADGCVTRKCGFGDGELLLGAEDGHLVIRAMFADANATGPTAPRRAVTPNAKDTQTMATARALGLPGAFKSEAPLGAPGATVGVVDGRLIVRDGAYTRTESLNEETPDIRYGDYDGDGLTDVLEFKTHAHFTLQRGRFGDAAALELATAGAKTIDEAASAVLALVDDPITVKEACGVLAKAATVKGLAGVLAPGGSVFGYQEPGQPAIGPYDVLTGKDAAAAFKGKCVIASCDARLATCASETDGPSTDYFQFVHVGKAWKLLRAAFYHGA